MVSIARLRPSPFLVVSALALSIAVASEVVASDYLSPAASRLKADVVYLADDAREGRGPGTRGLDDAAEYIAAVFREVGLKPAPGADGYFQRFEIRGEPRIEGSPTLVVKLPDEESWKGTFKADFSPLGVGSGGALEGAQLVFAGYGITAKDEARELDYDDYAGIDVKDKVVLILRREPQQSKEDSPFGGKETTPYATLQHKVSNAAKQGAKAVLLVNDAAGTDGGKNDELMTFDAVGGAGSIPFLMISREAGDRILDAAGMPKLADLEASIDGDLKPISKALDGVTVDLEVKVERTPYKVKNVIGVLEGTGPLAEETIVLGAHYDHVGYGGAGSLAFGTRAIHNGADDNASGTSMILELARRMAKRSDALPRRLVFMAYSAEERGLLGSDYYVKNPIYPLDQTVAMLNFDMVGRLDPEKRSLTVYGSGTAEGWGALVESLATSQGIKARNVQGTQEVFGASDHYSFYRKNIPVLFFFTGTHPDYHRPGDDSDKINYEGMSRIATLSELVLLDLAQRPDRPKFQQLKNAESTASVGATRVGSGVYLGSRPSYADSQNDEGVVLEGVTEGSPAEKAGLKGGDRIIRFAGKDVKNIEGYMEAMSGSKPGDSVEIVVVRDGKDVTVKATLGTRPSRSSQN